MSNLTQRQREVAELIADGYPDKQIQALLLLSASGVRCHIDLIADKLGLDRTMNLRVQIARLVIDRRKMA